MAMAPPRTRQQDKIERYLRVQVAEHAARGHQAGAAAVHPFVTISRQAGTGGHDLAEAMVGFFESQPDRHLFAGWQVFDRELCEIVARDPRFRSRLDSLVAEDYPSRAQTFFDQVLAPSVEERKVLGEIFGVVGGVASIGKAIIIGRGGSEVTRGMSPGVSIRIIAPLEMRLERLIQRRGIDRREAKALIKRLDGNRARLLKEEFRKDIDDPDLYDAVFSLQSVSYSEVGAAVAGLLALRAAR